MFRVFMITHVHTHGYTHTHTHTHTHRSSSNTKAFRFVFFTWRVRKTSEKYISHRIIKEIKSVTQRITLCRIVFN